jgi:hypothetical protein
MMMIDYKSMSNDELREALAAAAAELMSRRNATGGPSSTQHLYRIRMTRTPKAEPQAYRFTMIEDTVVQLPLPLDQIVGKTGRKCCLLRPLLPEATDPQFLERCFTSLWVNLVDARRVVACFFVSAFSKKQCRCSTVVQSEVLSTS